MSDGNAINLTSLTAGIVAAYVTNNEVGAEELATLIGGTYQALSTASAPAAPSEPETPKPDKAAVRKSISPEHLTSFVDGRRYKSLKRHLSTQGLTPDDYRERYGLPKDYPMVAANYSAQRSELAKSLGLGRKRTGVEAENVTFVAEAPAAAAQAPSEEGPPPVKVPRKRKVKPTTVDSETASG